jgi:hypothetical protein
MADERDVQIASMNERDRLRNLELIDLKAKVSSLESTLTDYRLAVVAAVLILGIVFGVVCSQLDMITYLKEVIKQ